MSECLCVCVCTFSDRGRRAGQPVSLQVPPGTHNLGQEIKRRGQIQFDLVNWTITHLDRRNRPLNLFTEQSEPDWTVVPY